MLHTLSVTPRTKPYSSSLCADLLYDRLNDFQPEPRAILDGAAVCVCAVVTNILQELSMRKPWAPWISTPSKPARCTALEAAVA